MAGRAGPSLTYLTLEAPREGQASHVHVHEIVAGLRDAGWHVDLYAPSYAGADRSPPLILRLFGMMALQAKIMARHRAGSVLYIRNHNMAFPLALWARVFGVPVFHEINGPYDDVFVTYPGLRPFRGLLVWMQRQQFRWATGLCAVTPQLADWAADQSRGRPVVTIPNGANTDLFHSDRARPADAPDRYAVFFGGLARWHGVGTMLDAVNHADWPGGVSLVMIGDGQEGDTARVAAAKNPRVKMMGRMAYADVGGYVAHALVGLVPISNPDNRSATGLYPLKLFETLACGVPAVVTDFPGQADLVRAHECGIVIPVDDPAALARAVAGLAADPARAAAMGRTGAGLVRRDYSWPALAARTDRFIREKTGQNPSG